MNRKLKAYLHSIGANTDSLDGWKIQPAFRDDEHVGFVVTNGPEIHILPTVEKKAISRRNIAEFIKPLLDEFGFVTTRVPLSETNHRLRVCLGFQRTWSDANYSYWALTKIPYERGVS